MIHTANLWKLKISGLHCFTLLSVWIASGNDTISCTGLTFCNFMVEWMRVKEVKSNEQF
jgi:hypothetical protein